MKLEEAKEILILNVKKARKQMPADTLKALKLGIESISAVQAARLASPRAVPSKLKGETL